MTQGHSCTITCTQAGVADMIMVGTFTLEEISSWRDQFEQVEIVPPLPAGAQLRPPLPKREEWTEEADPTTLPVEEWIAPKDLY